MASDTLDLTDLSEAEGAVGRPLLPGSRCARGCPRRHWLHTIRSTIRNAIGDVLRAGGAWRLLPNELPAWQTV